MKNTFLGYIRVIAGMILVSLLIVGCQYDLHEPSTTSQVQTHSSSVSKRIGELKEAGLLDSLLQEQSNRSVAEMDFSNVDMDKVKYFIANTDEALAEIAQLENGDVQIQLINALFTGGTIGEIADIMAEISEDMANDYLNAMENLNVFLESDIGQGRSAVSGGDIKNIRLSFFDEKSDYTTGRGAYAADLEADTVIWYSGFCAATVAGVWASTAVWPWVSIPGIVAAIAGGGSMVAQLVRWKDCSDLWEFAQKLYNRDIKKLNQIANTTHGPSIIAIWSLTGATAYACYVSPLGKTVTAVALSQWNMIMNRINQVISSLISTLKPVPKPSINLFPITLL